MVEAEEEPLLHDQPAEHWDAYHAVVAGDLINPDWMHGGDAEDPDEPLPRAQLAAVHSRPPWWKSGRRAQTYDSPGATRQSKR